MDKAQSDIQHIMEEYVNGQIDDIALEALLESLHQECAEKQTAYAVDEICRIEEERKVRDLVIRQEAAKRIFINKTVNTIKCIKNYKYGDATRKSAAEEATKQLDDALTLYRPTDDVNAIRKQYEEEERKQRAKAAAEAAAGADDIRKQMEEKRRIEEERKERARAAAARVSLGRSKRRAFI